MRTQDTLQHMQSLKSEQSPLLLLPAWHMLIQHFGLVPVPTCFARDCGSTIMNIYRSIIHHNSLANMPFFCCCLHGNCAGCNMRRVSHPRPWP